MVNIVDDRKDNSGTRGVYLALMVFGGIMMNICGSKFVGHFEIPLYLDSVGTMTVSMLGGFLPGIFVACVLPNAVRFHRLRFLVIVARTQLRAKSPVYAIVHYLPLLPKPLLPLSVLPRASSLSTSSILGA